MCMLAAAGGGCSLGGSHPALSQPISQPGLHFGSLNYIETRRTSCDVGNKPCVPPPCGALHTRRAQVRTLMALFA